MKHRTGFLHWMLPAMLGLVALTTLLSGRDLSQLFAELQAGADIVRHPIVAWAQRGVSILLLVISAERIISHIVLRKHLPSTVLALVFLAYWLATVAFPAVFGSHPLIAHEYLYTLVIGFAAVLAGPAEFDQIVGAARNALFAFLLAGFLLIPFDAPMVLDETYTLGLLPGLPRLGGLAPHPVALAMFAQMALLCLWCKPFERRWLTAAGWLVGGAALFLAQSKNAWVAFLLCALCMLAVRRGAGLWQRVGDPRRSSGLGVLVCLAVIGIALGVMGWILLGNVEEQAAGFFDSAEGAQLLSMTGRDRIWAVAIEEWQSNPMFGYGPGLWDAEYRASIGLLNATNAHNQFMDTLARSGSVGAAALVLYAGVLLVLSVRYAKATGGFSLALFVALALRSISEVPLLLFGYGTELFSHLLLIFTLASAAESRVHVAPAARTHSVYGVAS
ncbi:MAG TPA: O-antigen ligase family protein [Ramlibacter sp.]|nr:O-antigen ligase family protein [Ramlibacter sp.]